MKQLETNRLLLRKYEENDFAAVHSYGSSTENTTYMQFGPNTEAETRSYITQAIKDAENKNPSKYRFAVILKQTNTLIGGCDIHINNDEGEIGWIVHRNHQNKGYGTEMGQELLRYGFEELPLRRIVAHCDAENISSYRVMEKLNMRREGLFYDARPANKNPATNRPYSDELSYAILKSEWETEKQIAYYSSLPFEFNGFINIPTLTNGEIYLVCTSKNPAIPEKNYVPAYSFAVCKNGEKLGEVNLRIGYSGGVNNKDLCYCGQLGYHIDEQHRGNNYAAQASRLLLPIAKAHKMPKLLITNNYTNTASRRVSEKLGAKLVGDTVRLPEWSSLYKEGQRFINIFEWEI